TAMGGLPDLHSIVRRGAVRVARLGVAQGSADQPDADRRDRGTGRRRTGRGRLRVPPSRRLHPVYRAVVWRIDPALRPRGGDTRIPVIAMVIERPTDLAPGPLGTQTSTHGLARGARCGMAAVSDIRKAWDRSQRASPSAQPKNS